MPTVSIIVPIYNTETYLYQCLESIQKQSYHDFEVILVDDGSTDNSSSVYSYFIENDYRFKLIKTVNRGLSAARNTGISAAVGKYICLIDSDDWVEPNLLEEIIPSMKNNDIDLSIFWFYRINNITKQEKSPQSLPEKNEIISKEEALKGIIEETSSSYAWNKIYKRSLFSNIKYPENIRYCEDVATTHKLVLAASRIQLTNKILYHYRINNTASLTHNFDTSKCFDAFIASLERFNDLKKDYPQFNDKGAFYILRSADFFFCHYKKTDFQKKKLIRSKIKENCGNIYKYDMPFYLKATYFISQMISPYIVSVSYKLFSAFNKGAIK